MKLHFPKGNANIQYRQLIPAQVDRTSAQYLVVQTPMDNMSKKKPSTSITHVACESKLRSIVSAFVHPCPGHAGGWQSGVHALIAVTVGGQLATTFVNRLIITYLHSIEFRLAMVNFRAR